MQLKSRLVVPVLLMAAIVVGSNVAVQFFVIDGLLTWGAFTYPLAFALNDVVNRRYGPTDARLVVLCGFVVGVICSFAGTKVMLEHGPAVTTRIAIASGVGFLIAQMLNVWIFDRLRRVRSWRVPPLFSNTISSVTDTGIFFFVAFSATTYSWLLAATDRDDGMQWAQEVVPSIWGFETYVWVNLAMVDLLAKLLMAFMLVGAYRRAVVRIWGDNALRA